MSVRCDGCGTGKDVRRGFVTVWNGNILDLCKACQKPLGELIDRIWYKAANDDNP